MMDTLQKIKKSYFENIFVNRLEADSSIKVLDVLAKMLSSTGAVKKQYRDAVIEREINFPTGMPTKIPAAIPHTDSKYCLKKALAVGILEKPVKFGLMGGEDGQTVDTNLIFMLSLPDPKSQVVIIQKMLEIFRNEQMMKRLLELGKKDILQMKEMLANYFSGNIEE